MESFASPPRPTLSHELRALINQRNVLSAKSKLKVLNVLDAEIEENQKMINLNLRNKAIEEIFTSEVSYLHQLELILKFFKEPLDASDVLLPTKRRLLLPAKRRLLFGNIESIYSVNGELVNQLKIHGSNVGAAFLYLAPFFKIYSMYAYGYKNSLTLLEEETKDNQNLSQWLKRQERRPEVATSLSALLIAPIQRLPRYRLLLRQLVSLTPSTHPHYSTLTEAVKEVEKATSCIDSLVFEQERDARLVKLQQCFVNPKPSIVGPNKKLLKEGILMKMSSNGQEAQRRYFILLNDSIIYCRLKCSLRDQLPENPGSLKCRIVLPINKCSVKPVLGEGVFNLTYSSDTVILFSDHKENALEWVSCIQNAISEYHENMQTLRKKSSSCNPFHLNRKRKHLAEINVTTEEKDNEIPVKKSMYHQSIQEDAPKANYFQRVKSLFQSFGEAVKQYVYPR